MNVYILNSLFMSLIAAWAGYMAGKMRVWDEAYNLGHTHGKRIGMLDGALLAVKCYADRDAEEGV